MREMQFVSQVVKNKQEFALPAFILLLPEAVTQFSRKKAAAKRDHRLTFKSFYAIRYSSIYTVCT